MIAVLALDLGITTDWALRAADGGIVSGAQSLKSGRFEGDGMGYLRFRGWLTKVRAKAGEMGNRAQVITLGTTKAAALALRGWDSAHGAPASRQIESQHNDGRLTVPEGAPPVAKRPVQRGATAAAGCALGAERPAGRARMGNLYGHRRLTSACGPTRTAKDPT